MEFIFNGCDVLSDMIDECVWRIILVLSVSEKCIFLCVVYVVAICNQGNKACPISLPVFF